MNTLTLVCIQCGKPFERLTAYHRHLVKNRGIVRTFCSKECKNISERKADDATVVADYLSGKTLAEVAAKHGICQEAVRRRVMKAGVPLRSRTAHMAGERNPTKARGHTEATRAKIRAATVRQFSDPAARAAHGLLACKQIAEGRTGKAFNRLERKVADILAAEGLEFLPQHQVGPFVYDFFIPSTKTLVEAHGTFWHADPRSYDHSKLSAVQRKNVANDRRKATYAANHGFGLRIIWEADVM